MAALASKNVVPTLLIGGVGMLLRVYFSLSPLLICVLGLLAACVWSGNRRDLGGAEQVTPVYTPGVAAGLQWGVAAVQGRRPYMEDMHQVQSFDAKPLGMSHWFAVFDGHGGKRAAAWAHSHLAGNLLGEIAAQATPSKQQQQQQQAASSALDAAVVASFQRTDADFLKYAAARGIPDGSTAVTCMIQQGKPPRSERRLLVANLGDSRCVMVRTDGSALALSSDHKPNRPDERARVQAAGGQVIYVGCWRVQGDLAVSRAFGDAHLKKYGVSATPELSAFAIGPRDAFLVLASDGLWDVVDEQQCASSVPRASDALGAARALAELASVRGSMDNITVLVVAL